MAPRRLALCAVALLLGPAADGAPLEQRESLTVVSFNIRYGTAKDGDNAWPRRRAMLFHVLRAAAADVVGLQEALDFQVAEILAAVPGLAAVGVGREDGGDAGETCAILFRKDRLRVAEAGTFWFSDTPDVPNSRSWGNNLARICTWARFVDGDGRGFYHFNLHLDHQSQPSRERSTILLREKIEARAFRDDPVVISGDFNVGEDNPALATLTAPAGTAPFRDAFRVLHPDASEAGTFSDFTFGAVGGERIDYILVQPGTEVLAARIDHFSRNRRYPSDHFPVIATINLATRQPPRP
ncbi:MAG: endonuclease/exonuclease/phosphatase family protein [Acidobacteria bacterium]|nr:endonuclease/exonuclease/phosphatase family protein [Acidobacteriota bacterium]